MRIYSRVCYQQMDLPFILRLRLNFSLAVVYKADTKSVIEVRIDLFLFNQRV